MSFPAKLRRSASLLLAIPKKIVSKSVSLAGFQLLMLQRNSESKFMPNRFVFPGGMSEPSDFSCEWLELIGNKELPLQESLRNATFYISHQNQMVDSLPPHIGFRICAIRETFEESGVLLVKYLERDDNRSSKGGQHVCSTSISVSELDEWRREVMNNASSFIKLCKEIKCTPDIWSLYEWSNWVTPLHFLPLRFNTKFYFAFMNEKPEMSHDDKEVVNSMWLSPDDALKYFFKNKIILGPPQLFEMIQLCRLTTFNDLKTMVMSVPCAEAIEVATVSSKSGDGILFFPPDFMYERIMENNYYQYKEFLKTSKLKDVRKIPLVQLEETTEELIQTKDPNTYRASLNYKTKELKVACNISATKYNLPIFDNTFKKFKQM